MRCRKSVICSANQRTTTSRMSRTSPIAFRNVPGLWNAQPKSNDGPRTLAPGRKPWTPAHRTRQLAIVKSKRLRRTIVEATVV